MLSPSATRYLKQRGGTANFLSVAHDAHHALAFLVRSGVVDYLAKGPQTVEHLAAAFDLQIDALSVVLTMMIHFEIIERCEAGIQLGAEGLVLRAEERHQARYALLTASTLSQGCLHLAETLRTGRPGVVIAYGESYRDYAQRNEEARHNLAELGRAVLGSCDLFSTLIDLLIDRRHRSVADLSGGEGDVLRAVLDRVPTCHGILFDPPDAGSEQGQRLGAIARLSLAAGRLPADVPVAEAHILCNVLFNWSDADVLAILRAIRSAQVTPGSLYILDFFNDDSFESAFLNLDELIVTGGACRTVQAMQQLVDRSGFTVTSVLAGSTPFRLLDCAAVTPA